MKHSSDNNEGDSIITSFFDVDEIDFNVQITNFTRNEQSQIFKPGYAIHIVLFSKYSSFIRGCLFSDIKNSISIYFSGSFSDIRQNIFLSISNQKIPLIYFDDNVSILFYENFIIDPSENLTFFIKMKQNKISVFFLRKRI